MPERTSTRIPKYRLHKPTVLAVVRLNGRDIYLGKHATDESRQRYQQVVAEWLANSRQLVARRELVASPQALCVAGTPEDCIKAVEERMDAGVEHINLGFLASDTDDFYRQMEMFASQVIPHFQG